MVSFRPLLSLIRNIRQSFDFLSKDYQDLEVLFFFIHADPCFRGKTVRKSFPLARDQFLFFGWPLFGWDLCLVGLHHVYLPSQFLPRNRLLQRQLYPKGVSLQVPPLRHGSALQNSTTAKINRGEDHLMNTVYGNLLDVILCLPFQFCCGGGGGGPNFDLR